MRNNCPQPHSNEINKATSSHSKSNENLPSVPSIFVLHPSIYLSISLILKYNSYHSTTWPLCYSDLLTKHVIHSAIIQFIHPSVIILIPSHLCFPSTLFPNRWITTPLSIIIHSAIQFTPELNRDNCSKSYCLLLTFTLSSVVPTWPICTYCHIAYMLRLGLINIVHFNNNQYSTGNLLQVVSLKIYSPFNV